MKKIPMRMCVVTREKMPKKDLIRVVYFNDTFTVDMSGKLNGKGCYLKKDLGVIDTAQKKKILDNVFEKSVPDEIYDELRSSI